MVCCIDAIRKFKLLCQNLLQRYLAVEHDNEVGDSVEHSKGVEIVLGSMGGLD
jgi:hypothetical protein